MKYPSYVPAPVQKHVTAMIEGDRLEPHGLSTSLSNAEQELRKIAQAIEIRIQQGAIESLPRIRLEEADAKRHREIIANHIDCLQRLVHDARMRDAYLLLIPEISTGEQWRSIINCARTADDDFEDFRKRLKLAEEAKEEVAEAGERFATALSKFNQTGVEGPEEFYSVQALLRKTDNNEFGGRNRYIWKATRKDVLGDRETKPKIDGQHELDLPLPEFESELKNGNLAMHHINIQFVSPEEHVDKDPLAGLRYGWKKAPPFSALVVKVAQAARDFKPREFGMVAAALESRQGNVKTQYVRALAYLLLTANKFRPTNCLMRAMAVIATVVINLPDVVVTYDDVRKALMAQIKDWNEPPRVLRRLQHLREWSHEKVEQVFPRSA